MKQETGALSRLLGTLRKMFTSTAGAVFVVTIVLTLIVHITTGNFYTPYNILTFTRQISFVILIGFAQTLVLLMGGIDLSVAAISSLSSMLVSQMLVNSSLNPWLSIILALVLGSTLGLINGLIIAHLRITPFIVTLGTSELFRGVVYVITKGKPIVGIPESVAIVGQGNLFGTIPYPAIITVVIFIILVLMLRYTALGRHIYAVGGNEGAARIVGIRIKRVKISVYTIVGLISALTGVLMVLRLGSYKVSVGENWVMPSITAAVLGGTSMSGGVGGVGGTVVGGLLIGTISFTIGLMGISSYWELVITGGVVLIAIIMDAINSKSYSKFV